jgi:purine-binding chemotaxis protein CheW
MTTKQFVTFRIEDRLVGMDIMKVREVNRVIDITPVPHAPDYVRGLVNLRGQTVSVLDLGVLLGFDQREVMEQSRNIILKNDDIGLLVDEIGDVEEATNDEIEPPPANLNGIELEFIECVVKLKGKLLTILSPEKIRKTPEKQGGFA